MLWVVKPRKLWGDYGDMLISGMIRRGDDSGRTFWGNFGRRLLFGTSRKDDTERSFLWERTGPFLPPLAMPFGGDWSTGVIVSDDLRRELEAAGFDGLRFGPVVASHVVRLDWHLWDLSADEPAVYPEGGEPECYLMGQPHNREAAAQLPTAWEVLGPVVPLPLFAVAAPGGGYLDHYRAGEVVGIHPSMFLNCETYGYLVVDDTGREWLTKHAGEWVRFCEVESSSTAGQGGTA